MDISVEGLGGGAVDIRLVVRDGKYYATGWVTTKGERTRLRKSLGVSESEGETKAKIALEELRVSLALKVERKLTVADIIDLYVNRPGYRHESQAYHAAQLHRLWGGFLVEELNHAFIEKQCIQNCPDTWSMNTVRKNLGMLKAALRRAHHLGVIPDNIDVRIPPEVETNWRWLDKEQRDRFLESCDEELLPLATFLFFTGARLKEAEDCKWGDLVSTVDEKGDKCVRVTLANRKNQKRKLNMRSVVAHQRVLEAIYPKRNETYVLRRKDGSWWPKATLQTAWRVAAAAAGVGHLTRHDARHSFASQLANDGVSLRVVCELLGHSSIKMVMRYQHLSPGAGDDDVMNL